MRPDVLGVGPLPVAEDLGLRPISPKSPDLAPRFPDTQVSALLFQIPGTQIPTSFKPGSLFYRISNIWGSGPCVPQCPGFIPQPFRYRIHFVPLQIHWVHTPESEIRDRPRIGEGLDREVRSGCHPLPSRGGFPGPPLRKGESRGRGGKGKGLLAPRPAWENRWRTPGGSGGAGAL